MRYGIISDIHSNREALDACLRALDRLRIDTYVCLGDVVGYGADPAYCVETVRNLVELGILGNHDAAVAGKMDYSYYYEAAREVLNWSRRQLNEEQVTWLQSLPYSKNKEEQGICFTHGDPIQPEAYNYVYTVEQASYLLHHYEKMTTISFVGHSHLRRVYLFPDHEHVRELQVDNIKLESDKKYLVAVGAVGQPRDYDPRSSFCVFDTETQKVTLHRVEYDVEGAARKIMDAGLPESFAYRLFNGI